MSTLNSKANPAEIIELSLDEMDALIDRMERDELSPADKENLRVIVYSFIHMQQRLLEKSITIKKLLREFVLGAKGEKSKDILKDKGSDSAVAAAEVKSGRVNEDDTAGDENKSANEAENEEEKNNCQKKKKGHGRNGASAYKEASQIYVSHPDLKVGDKCPQCPSGSLYKYKRSKKFVRIKGQPPFKAEVYELEKLRCSSCLAIFTAPVPPGAGSEKYDEQAGAQLCLLKYGNGFAFNRLEKFLNNLGIPLASSTQWEIVEGVGYKVAPIYNEFIKIAAQGDVLHNDDTYIKILSMMKNTPEGDRGALSPYDDKEKPRLTEFVPCTEPGRTGMFTTGIVAEVGSNQVTLYVSGGRHAGENLEQVLTRRLESLPPPIQMCDAASRNIPKDLETIVANCLSHGRRNFVNLYDVFPDECRIIIDLLALVYRNEMIARAGNLSPRERLEYHQRESGPVMEKLKQWFDLQFEEKRVEENSRLGKAIRYMQKHWKKLTLFLRVEKAPLDNNVVERGLKFAILNRKNSYFFKTVHGAEISDILMSIIKTCYEAKVNAFEYLVLLQKHELRVRQNPGQWLPWNFKDTLMALGQE